MSKLPIFYDKTKKRWPKYKWPVLTLIFLALVFLVFTSYSTSENISLPDPGLPKPTTNFRGVSNAPAAVISSPATNQVASTALATNNTLKNPGILASSAPVASTSYQKPKSIAFYVNWDDTSLSSLKANLNSIDEIVPEWLHLGGADGSLQVDDENRQGLALDYIRQNKNSLLISPLINNFSQTKQDWDGEMLTQMLQNPSARANTIQGLLDFVQKNNFSGVSIDFENVSTAAQPNLTLFMKELYTKFHPLGLEVSQNIPLDDLSFNAQILGSYSDFLILMAYDQNSAYATQAGPVSAQDWFRSGITKRFSELSPQKYVIAIGNYGYDWTGENVGGQDLSFQEAVLIASEAKASIHLDSVSQNPTFDYYDDVNALHHVWYLDAATVFNQISAAKAYNPYGYALWRLGSEDPSVWKVFDGRETLGHEVVQSLEKMQYGYDVDYEGEGEVLRVTDVPKVGSRSLVYDDKSGQITAEEVTDFPSPYIISRWGGQDKKKIALTFDDGPDNNYTARILDILKQKNAKATFFVVGVNANQHPELLKRMDQEGQEIGNHTFSHPNITTISNNQFKIELNGIQRLLQGVIGRGTLLFRPPYAEDIEPETPAQIGSLLFANDQGYYTVGMHIDPGDWSRPGVDEIIRRTVDGAVNGEGNIVLLHDSGGDREETVQALPALIDELRARGFEIVTVSDLLNVSRDTMMPPVSSSEKTISRINGVTFSIFDLIGSFFYWLFIIGIILGSLRLAFVVILAVIQWGRCRFGRLCLYEKGYYPSVSVVIPAYNEEKVITRTIESLLKSNYPAFDIIVVDDGSSDGTYDRLLDNFSLNERVKIFTKENGGKSSALNFGIRNSNSEIIVALDADTLFAPDTIRDLARHFSDSRIGAVAGNTKVGNRINILTRWQALEYITSQNLDRRAFDLMNSITVVPGSVGAWRRDLILKLGGFSNETLAEDADLTFTIIRNGYRVVYDDEAIAFTEAPDTVRGFVKQRFRWMFGTLQTAWKHKDTAFRPKYGAMGSFAIPNIFVFQIFFPLISPFMDLALLISMGWAFWQRYHHPVDYSLTHTFQNLLFYYLFFLAVDMLAAVIAFSLEHKKEDWTLLFWMFLQRFFYRQLMYYVAIKTTAAALKGVVVGWGKLERKATVLAKQEVIN